jgi:hypothetical protein
MAAVARAAEPKKFLLDRSITVPFAFAFIPHVFLLSDANSIEPH